MRWSVAVVAVAGCVALGACGGGAHPKRVAAEGTPSAFPASAAPSASPSASAKKKKAKPKPKAKPFRAGNPAGGASVPAEARAVDTRHATTVIGKGSPKGCTSAAVVAAVAKGGVVTFDCGPRPVTITMAATAKVVNRSSRVVLDGGGLVTLSGAGKRRILYMNTCDQKQGWTTSHCNDQPTPRLVLQNIGFANGNSTGQKAEGGGGGAVFVRGGRLLVVNARFTGNRCDATGPDLGGAALRVLDQSGGRPVYVTSSTFSGGVCSNGGALSGIGTSWTVLNSLFTGNRAIGRGANPARGGTPGGGSGGAIYADGNRFAIRLAGTVVQGNRAAEGGGAIFFVSNDRTGTLALDRSRLLHNPSARFETAGYPGIFFLGAGKPRLSGSTLRR
ncbi:hypothetical protein [Actinomadura parmotrematis]|uniref:Right-handed parallel beta-helix repeat-containing protein n=1 Tax=Actinomadura parmotrematis TaxID=2864039 RepID=A0ABS7FM01_9ACTN|nr:hypothetical protein [Actinomadura parmotrematis]MBW8481412.1 hypothetical protein [Actinomadura parmotrematis]